MRLKRDRPFDTRPEVRKAQFADAAQADQILI